MLIGIDASRATRSRRTGTEAYTHFLIQALIPQAESRGYRLRLYFNRPPAPDLFARSPAVETRVIRLARLWTHLRLAAELRRRPPDVFFTPAHVIPISYYGPSVATVHDLGYLAFPEAHTRRQLAYLRWSTAHNARRSRLVLADSAATRADLSTHYGIDPGKIRVIYPGADPLLAPVKEGPELAQVRERYGLHKPYLLAIGTIQPRKNLERLVEAFAASGITATAGAQLVLAGMSGWRSGPILETVERNQRRLPGGQPAIILPGYVAVEDKAALISGAQALLFPSLYEGFGFPILEGNACGTPVLAADTSSLPEIAGQAALLVDPLDTGAIAEGINRITTDHPLRMRLAEAGLANVKRFSWEEAAGQVLAALEQAAGQ
jgi:glycosyltransferase involved in cell wall biosynthesis